MSRLVQGSAIDRHRLSVGPPSLIQRSRALPRWGYLAMVIGLSAITFALGFAALYLTPRGENAAIWWPAAGSAALLYLVYRGPKWQVLALVAAVGVVSNIASGRPLVFAVWGMVILVSELVVLTLLLGRPGSSALLMNFRGLVRLVIAALGASATVGLLGAAAFFILAGANPFQTFVSLVPSHLSALLIIVPVALVPLPRRVTGQRIELAVQIVLAAGVTVLVFSPLQNVAIGALLFPFFGWAAVRFRPIVAVTELVLLSAVSSVLTVLGGGPYGNVIEATVPTAFLLQIYLLSIAVTVHIIVVVRTERAQLQSESERRAALWRGGFVGSQVGTAFVTLNQEPGLQVLEVNEVAASLIDASWLEPLVESWRSSDAVEHTVDVRLDSGRTVQVNAQHVHTDEDHVLVLQLVDVTDFVTNSETLARILEHERRAADELRSLSQQKDDFISSVSHELRTPITSIVGFAEELSESASADQALAAEIILRNADRLTEMVEQLLEIGRLTAPNPVRETYSIDLTLIARQTVEEQSGIAQARGIVVTERLSPVATLIDASSNTLGRIVTNLLSNAIKFSPEGGVVEISTESDGRAVTLVLDDSGPGISDADAPRVWERFFRSEDATKRLTPGTGLGLSIVKSLVELSGGRVSIDRSPLGGARLTVTLPEAAPTRTPVPTSPTTG